MFALLLVYIVDCLKDFLRGKGETQSPLLSLFSLLWLLPSLWVKGVAVMKAYFGFFKALKFIVCSLLERLWKTFLPPLSIELIIFIFFISLLPTCVQLAWGFVLLGSFISVLKRLLEFGLAILPLELNSPISLEGVCKFIELVLEPLVSWFRKFPWKEWIAWASPQLVLSSLKSSFSNSIFLNYSIFHFNFQFSIN